TRESEQPLEKDVRFLDRDKLAGTAVVTVAKAHHRRADARDGKAPSGADGERLFPHNTLVRINWGHVHVDEFTRRNHHKVALALPVDFINGWAVYVLDHRLQPQDLMEQTMSLLFRP